MSETPLHLCSDSDACPAAITKQPLCVVRYDPDLGARLDGETVFARHGHLSLTISESSGEVTLGFWGDTVRFSDRWRFEEFLASMLTARNILKDSKEWWT